MKKEKNMKMSRKEELRKEYDNLSNIGAEDIKDMVTFLLNERVSELIMRDKESLMKITPDAVANEIIIEILEESGYFQANETIIEMLEESGHFKEKEPYNIEPTEEAKAEFEMELRNIMVWRNRWDWEDVLLALMMIFSFIGVISLSFILL